METPSSRPNVQFRKNLLTLLLHKCIIHHPTLSFLTFFFFDGGGGLLFKRLKLMFNVMYSFICVFSLLFKLKVSVSLFANKAGLFL